MRAGCNTGSCHGAARGKDGFRLSLFGFDPDGDHYRLTREQPKRRLNLAIPAESLLIEKATGKVPHTGGSGTKKGEFTTRSSAGSRPARPLDPPTVADARRASNSTRQRRVLDGKGETQQLTVRAKYSDGTDRDVTSLAVFLIEQRQLGHRSPRTASSPPATAARRSSWPGSTRFTVGVAVHRAAQGLAVQVPGRRRRTTTSTTSSTPSSRSCASAPSEPLHRRGLPPPRLPRHRRPAADARGVRAVHGRRRPRTSARSWSTSCSTARSSPSSG